MISSVDFDDYDDDDDEDYAADCMKRHFSGEKSLSLCQPEVAVGVEAPRLHRSQERHRPEAKEVEEDAGDDGKNEII